ncbi:MAG: helix-turn-helix transcriptional regulator [Clostridia bacterium]|nr:helix-turn-helix transcriptional regulator [Clostridia bacterium]
MTLKEARENARYTKRAAAKIIGVSENTIYKWEQGKTTPNVKQYLKLCKIYDCQLSDIFFN